MMTFILFVVALAGLLIVMRRESGATSAIGVMAVTGLLSLIFASGLLALVLVIGAALTAAAGLPGFRQSLLTPRIFAMFQNCLLCTSDAADEP